MVVKKLGYSDERMNDHVRNIIRHNIVMIFMRSRSYKEYSGSSSSENWF